MVGPIAIVGGAVIAGGLYVLWNVYKAGELASEGDGLHRQGRSREALAKYDEAIKKDGSNARYHTQRGHVLRALGRARDALEAYRAAAEREPKSSAALTDVAQALLELNRPREAHDAASVAISASAGNTEARRIAGEALWGMGMREEAVDAMRELARMRDTAGVRARIAAMLHYLGRHAEELVELERAVSMNANDARLHLRVGHARFLVGKGDPKRRRRLYTGAIASYERALEINRHDAEASMALDYARGQLAGMDPEGGPETQDP